MPYGILKCDTVTFTDTGVDKSVSISGLVQNPTFSGNVTVTGTISGVTVTGTTASFTSGNFTNISGGTHTITSGVFAAGSATNPSISFTSDPNTGIYSPGADQVAISSSGVGRLFINSSGNAGIGTSTPNVTGFGGATVLTVSNTASSINTGVVEIQGGSSGNGLLSFLSGAQRQAMLTNTSDGQLQFWTGGASISEKLRITADGKVGLGTSSPSATTKMSIADSTSAGIYLLRTGQGETVIENTGSLTIRQSSGNSTNQNIFFKTGNSVGTEVTAMTIDGLQRVGIGTESPSSATKMSIVDSASAGIYLFRIGQGESFIENTGSLVIRQSSGNSANQNIYFKTGASAGTEVTAMTIDGSQRVGVGTTSPQAAVDVVNNSTYQIRVATGTGDYADGGIYLGSLNTSDPNYYGYIRYVNSDQTLRLGNQSYSATGGICFFTGTTSAPTEKARFDSFGRLLVGAASTSSASALVIQNNSSGNGVGVLRINYSTASPGTNDTLGVVSFGDNTHGEYASVAGLRDGGTWSASSKPTRLVFSTTADGASSPTERMRITQGGDLLIGQETNPATSRVVVQVQTGTANGVSAQITSNTGTSYPWSNYNASGTYVGGITCTSTATSFPTSSDYRLKTNVQPLGGAIDLVTQLKPSTFEFIENPSEIVQGFIAHELQEVVPLAVIGEKDAKDANGNPIYQGVDAAKLVPLLTAALQEAVAKIESLEARLTAAGI